ncbi:LysM peptidoglycan-binding domain-containing protein [Gemmatimonas aurantiaca]|nr:LysM peptidoglycan-binding domain-containing protein [Gemmatimonas aurantiaca]
MIERLGTSIIETSEKKNPAILRISRFGAVGVVGLAVVTLTLMFSSVSCTRPGSAGRTGSVNEEPSGAVANDAGSDKDGSSSGGQKETVSRGARDPEAPDSHNTDTDWVVVALDEDNVSPTEVSGRFSANGADADLSAAVDDDIWRQMDLAGEFFTMGVVANQDGAWDEAQYYFERALKTLGELDIESEQFGDSTTAEWRRYNGMIDNIVAQYNVTLLSLGKLPADISPSAMIEKFSHIDPGGDLIVTHEETTHPSQVKSVVTYDMPIIINDRVQASIKYFQTDARDAFIRYYSRSTRYLPMIHEIIRSYGLPEDLAYLPLIESGYNPKAYSWAKATGLWQFISSTGKQYGLKRSWWYDERRDPIKATHAACKFLTWLYKEFGDWELALASYNAGPGKVRRTMKRDKTKDYWKLRHLKRETRNYVPLYMAATIISKNPEKYGFHLDEIEFQAPLAYDEVVIDRCLELKTVAKGVGATVEELIALNPELLRKHTPPKAKKYNLHIPINTKSQFLAAYPAMESPQETSWVRHKIRRGESISTIASRYGVSQYAIREANNMRSSRIIAGKTLIVPVPLDGQYASSRPSKKRNATNGVYIVRRGDSIYEIARSFGIKMSALKNLNSVGSKGRIYVGQQLRIPGMSGTLASAKKNSSPSKNSVKNSSKLSDNNSSSGVFVSHKVRRGENLSVISKRYSVTVAQVRRWNNMGRSTMIHPGQRLRIRSNDNNGNGSSGTYAVRRGDSLWEIARKYGLTVSKLIVWNDLPSSGRIKPGQSLRLSAPGIGGGSNKDSSNKTVWYTIRRGDNLSNIAKSFQTTVQRLMAVNSITNPRRLRVGSKIKISG